MTAEFRKSLEMSIPASYSGGAGFKYRTCGPAILIEIFRGFLQFAASVIRAIIALMMEAARTSETSVDNKLRTRQYIPEDSELHTRRRGNLKSHNLKVVNSAVHKANTDTYFTLRKQIISLILLYMQAYFTLKNILYKIR
jgi:hypothetical protein